MKQLLVKWTPQDVERLVVLFALQSASLKLSRIHSHSAGSGVLDNKKSFTPMFPTRFINPIILRKRANPATVGHDMLFFRPTPHSFRQVVHHASKPVAC